MQALPVDPYDICDLVTLIWGHNEWCKYYDLNDVIVHTVMIWILKDNIEIFSSSDTRKICSPLTKSYDD